ncbi:hypothetical protein ACWCSD_11825 [Nonomuraea sp. NPDC001684]
MFTVRSTSTTASFSACGSGDDPADLPPSANSRATAGLVQASRVIAPPCKAEGHDATALLSLMTGATCLTSALTLVGRVTGREIDREWMNGTHTRYVIRDKHNG